MLYLGLLAGVTAGNQAAHRLGINPFRAWAATLILIVFSLIGARALYVVTHWSFYRHHLSRIANRRDGGGSLYGGILLALFLSPPLLRLLSLNFGRFWDAAAFTILVGMIFTRAGCLLNGCCAGRPHQGWLALSLPNSHGIRCRRIPTQILEALWAALLLVAAIFWHRAAPFPGSLFLLLAAGYAAGRFVLESLRELPSRQHDPAGLELALNCAISLIVVLASISTLTLFWRT